MTTTTISWTDKTWNVTRGCRRVSPGCENCYAERQANRFAGKGGAYEGLIKRSLRTTDANDPDAPIMRVARWSGETRFAVDHLADPLRWRKPCRIFVDSMSDLFYEGFEDEQIDLVFAVMLLSSHHTFQVLTKRAERMRRYFEAPDLYERVLAAACHFREKMPRLNQIGISDPALSPARWIWLGVSVEDQQRADERIPELLRTPAAVRFLSCEPLLGPVDLTRIGWYGPEALTALEHVIAAGIDRPPIDWVIAGCESGPGARPCDVAWLRALRDQCAAAGVPYFLKQAVAQLTLSGRGEPITFGAGSFGKGNVIELPYLDGVQHAAFPTETP